MNNLLINGLLKKNLLKKRFVGAMLALVCAFSMIACGQATEEVVEPVIVTPEKIYIYSYNENIKNELTSVLEEGSELSELIEYVILPEENYGETVSQLIENGEAEKYPAIVVSKLENVSTFVNSNKIVGIDELGVTDQDCSQMYEYTKLSDGNGKVKGISGTVKPGAFIYRKVIAKELFGTDDAKEIQSYVQDWRTFEDTARYIYKATEKKTAMLASTGAIEKAFMGSNSDLCEDVTYILSNEGFALKNDINTPEYIKAASKNAVFGYLVDSDFITNGLAESFGGMRATLGYAGDWAICQGPAPYITGGDWIFVTGACGEKEEIGNLLKKAYCETSVLEKRRNETNAFVNNMKVMSNASNSGKGKVSVLGGLDYIEVFDKQAKAVKLNLENENDNEEGQ